MPEEDHLFHAEKVTLALKIDPCLQKLYPNSDSRVYIVNQDKGEELDLQTNNVIVGANRKNMTAYSPKFAAKTALM